VLIVPGYSGSVGKVIGNQWDVEIARVKAVIQEEYQDGWEACH